MKPFARLLSIIALGVILVQLTSCKKIIDKLFKDPVATLDACYINKITDNYQGRTFLFTYNSLGNPVTVTNDMVATAYPNYHFWYDSENRLTDFIGLYTNGNYESWHKYGYDILNRIVKDTQYVFGVFGPEPDPSSYSIIEHTYTYDASKRIIKDDGIYIQPAGNSPFTNTYTYNASGNLTSGSAYDTKVNLHRTNKIWMFVSRNYSLNNPIPAVSYNGYALPLEFNHPSPYNFLRTAINESTIEYVCP